MFVDDGTIHTKANQNYVDETARCLKQLMWHAISIELAKCTWGTDEANLIGREVRCVQGIRVDTGKVADLLAISHLEPIGDLKSFLGACVYLRRFIKDCAMIPSPLYALGASQKTKTNRTRHTGENANWTPQHERAFKPLKAALGTAPCLEFQDWIRPFIVSVDCSKCQMGGALLQIRQGWKRTHNCIHLQPPNSRPSELGSDINRKWSIDTLHQEVQSIWQCAWPPSSMSARSQGATVSNDRQCVCHRST